MFRSHLHDDPFQYRDGIRAYGHECPHTYIDDRNPAYNLFGSHDLSSKYR
jgi:hypothetical protein